MTRFAAWASVLVLSMGVYGIDRVTKLAAGAVLLRDQSAPVVSGIFHLTLVHNRGGAFGLFRDQRLFFIALSVLAIICIILYLWKHAATGPAMLLGFGLIVGGALGNLYDRIAFGYVIDFLDFRIWPVFNVADAAISTGVGILLIYLIGVNRTPAAQ